MINLKNQTLLVIAPHPDDEVLGCGGMIKRIKEEGGKVYILFMTVGTTADYSATGSSSLQERIQEIEKVAEFMEYDDYAIAFPGNNHHLKLDNIPQLEIISAIEKNTKVSLNNIRPTIIACPQPADYNQDHRACAKAVFAACRPAPNDFKSLTPIVLTYEFAATALWSIESPRTPNVFIKLNQIHLDTKIKAMELYSSQVRVGSNPRSVTAIQSLAISRGVQTGVAAAEAYHSFRFLI